MGSRDLDSAFDNHLILLKNVYENFARTGKAYNCGIISKKSYSQNYSGKYNVQRTALCASESVVKEFVATKRSFKKYLMVAENIIMFVDIEKNEHFSAGLIYEISSRPKINICYGHFGRDDFSSAFRMKRVNSKRGLFRRPEYQISMDSFYGGKCINLLDGILAHEIAHIFTYGWRDRINKKIKKYFSLVRNDSEKNLIEYFIEDVFPLLETEKEKSRFYKILSEYERNEAFCDWCEFNVQNESAGKSQLELERCRMLACTTKKELAYAKLLNSYKNDADYFAKDSDFAGLWGEAVNMRLKYSLEYFESAGERELKILANVKDVLEQFYALNGKWNNSVYPEEYY